MLVFLMLNVILLPLVISFSSDGVNPGWLTFSCFSDVIFLSDILLNFWTGYITEENVVILDLKQIRKFYIKRWLTLDILSVFPFDYIMLGIFQAQSLTALCNCDICYSVQFFQKYSGQMFFPLLTSGPRDQ